MEGLRQRFLGRLEASALSLSSRETEVCVGLLAGLTVPQLAERLDLKVSTVESYFKRAAVKWASRVAVRYFAGCMQSSACSIQSQ